MRRLHVVAPLTWLAWLASLLLPLHVEAQQAPLAATLSTQGDKGDVPPLPPEYLNHEQAGFVFSYHPSTHDRVRSLFEIAESTRRSLAEQLGCPVLESVTVRIAMGPVDFQRIAPGGVPLSVNPLILGSHNLAIITLDTAAEDAPQLETLFSHAMAHLALGHATSQTPLPRWFEEGFALGFSGQASLVRYYALSSAVLQDRMIAVSVLDRHLVGHPAPGSLAAAEASDFVRFGSSGKHRGEFLGLVSQLRAQEPFLAALGAAYEADLEQLEQLWRADLAKNKAFLSVLALGSAFFGLLASAVSLHVWRKRARKREATRAQGRARPSALELRWIEHDSGPGSRQDRPLTAALPEPEVPKVSHDGRWHTLH